MNPNENAMRSTAIAQKHVAVVTGAAQGIGRAIARRLVRDGFAVVLSDVDPLHGQLAADRLGKEIGLHAAAEAIFVRADISREEDVEALFASVRDTFGRLDALVNNAGIASPENGPIEGLDLARWTRVIDTNLTGAFLCAKHAARMLRDANGSIVNISSTRSGMSEANTEAYSAAKGGLAAFTRALAISLAPDVRVNAISPGWIDVSSERFEKADGGEVSGAA